MQIQTKAQTSNSWLIIGAELVSVLSEKTPDRLGVRNV